LFWVRAYDPGDQIQILPMISAGRILGTQTKSQTHQEDPARAEGIFCLDEAGFQTKGTLSAASGICRRPIDSPATCIGKVLPDRF